MSDLEIIDGLKFLYGDKAEKVNREVQKVIAKYDGRLPSFSPKLTEKDAVVITYADTIRERGEFPLKTLKRFFDEQLSGLVNTIHILPFYPYTSDDGFAVTDYFSVHREFGSWEHIRSLSEKYHLMFDAVINHMSKSSAWFQEFLAGNPDYAEFFLQVDKQDKRLAKVFRPRTWPLVHNYPTPSGQQVNVWTTFSEDQVDLNFTNGKVFTVILDLLLFYISKGARLIRLDAVGFLWKRLGTSCIHLPETHLIIQLYRKIIEQLTKGVLFITETNVPHKDNISYFGNGQNEAHLVYNFTLPPLLAYSVVSSNVEKLGKWLSELQPFSLGEVCYFNFTASHDGVGLQPVKDILTQEEQEVLVHQAKANGGFISYKNNPDGSRSPYELNCTYLDLLSQPDDSLSFKARKFILTQAFMLTLPGLPGIYIHSILGTENDKTGVEESGIYRRINRAKLDYASLLNDLNDESSLRHRVFTNYKKILDVRKKYAWFNPFLPFTSEVLNNKVIVIKKIKGDKQFIGVFNFSSEEFLFYSSGHPQGLNLITSEPEELFPLSLPPYGFRWIESLL